MSRMQAVKSGGPGTSTRLIASSAGNSVPSERIAWTSIRRPRRAPAPGAGPTSLQRSSACRCDSRRRRRNDESGELAAENLLLRVAERALGCDVELEDVPAVVDRDDARRAPHRGSRPACAGIGAQRCLGRHRPGVGIVDHRLTTIVASQNATRPPEGGTSRQSLVARRAGKRMTSRIVSRPERSITRRSIPRPSPPVGGMP